MVLTDTIAVEPDLNTEQEALELLLHDREWVQAEFAAIVNASRFGDRIIVGTIPHPPRRDLVRWILNAMHGESEMTRMGPRASRSRVRSPPGR